MKIRINTFFVASILAILPLFASASITTAISSGNWNTSSTWDGGVPSCGDTVWINPGVTVTIATHVNLDEASSPACSTAMFLYIQGTLDFITGKKLYLPCNTSIQLDDDGQITKGSGGGNSNIIDVCQNTVWRAGDGNLSGPLVLTGNGLPIELKSFLANYESDRVVLHWTTLSEVNNDYFTIERSSDLESYEEIEFVQGAGNSREVLDYYVEDADPLVGISYYRLKQTDYDGKTSRTSWRAVSIEKDLIKDITSFPTRVEDELFLKIIGHKGQHVSIVFADARGDRMKEMEIYVDSEIHMHAIQDLPPRRNAWLFLIVQAGLDQYVMRIFH